MRGPLLFWAEPERRAEVEFGTDSPRQAPVFPDSGCRTVPWEAAAHPAGVLGSLHRSLGTPLAFDIRTFRITKGFHWHCLAGLGTP